MSAITLKSLHNYLGVVEIAYKLRRKTLANANQRTLREGLVELSRLSGLDEAVFNDPQYITAMIGAQRFVIILGEPSLTANVARTFDATRALLAVLIDPAQSAPGHPGSTSVISHQQNQARPGVEVEAALENLKPLLTGNLALTCRLFRALFEHLLGFASPSAPATGSSAAANDPSGSKEYGRCLLAVQLYVLGAEVDHENLLPFMLANGYLGIQNFEQLIQNRDYCETYYAFRRVERAFIASPVEEEAQLRTRVDAFVTTFGGKPAGTKVFDAAEQDKARIDAHLAAFDLIETMALTPWSLALHAANSAIALMCIRSIKATAQHFEKFAGGDETKDEANQQIADHLLAFIRQFAPRSKVPAAA